MARVSPLCIDQKPAGQLTMSSRKPFVDSFELDIDHGEPMMPVLTCLF